MKKVFLLFVSIAMIGFTSCSKDDDNVTNPLLGKWRILSVNTTKISNLNDCTPKSWILFEEETITSKEFEKDENNECISEKYTVKYKKDGNKLKVTPLEGDDIILFFKIEGDKLTLDGEDGIIVYKKI
ncbi:MAG: hypothetical protein CR961_01670 [Polaribacter sp.]|nr:MAG: hypothetical protein CR961_01670 [Polaribacter sp.]